MTDIVPQILILTSWCTNCCQRRKERQEAYRDAENLVFFRPAEASDLPVICRLEVLLG